VTDYLALGCLFLALLILQVGVRQKTRQFHRFLQVMWVLALALSGSVLLLSL
jgi:hypothetical protein